MKRMTALALILTLAVSLTACGKKAETQEAGQTTYDGATAILLSDDGITVDGQPASTDETAAVYTANDIVFYLEGQGIAYGEGTEDDEHSQAEADAHTVVHIAQPGTYVLSGSLSAGQVAVDLGEDAEDDPNAVVNLILNGADITCTVAPAVIFYNVYECGSTDTETAVKDVDTSAAGANVTIADGTVNNITGSYVARIYKPDSVELSEDGTEVVESKKLHKYDGAFYSRMSMNVDGGEQGNGVLNITAENEGLDSELHLTVNGANINITSGNDGINTNEDGVSVTTINGGLLTIDVDGATGEGDGIDSNGWLVINGGTVIAAACGSSQDAGIDSDNGIYINGGTVAASGNMLDRIDGGDQPYVVFSFRQRQQGGTTVTLKAEDGSTAGEWAPVNDFTYLVVSGPDLTEGTYTLWSGETQLAGAAGMTGGRGMGGFRPDGAEPPEGFEMPEGMEPPKGDLGRQPGKERPQPNEDGTITLPDGTVIDPSELKRPEDGEHPMRPGGEGSENMEDVEVGTDFVLTAEGGTFGNISAAE